MYRMTLNIKPVNFRTFQDNIESLHAFSRAEDGNNLALAQNGVDLKGKLDLLFDL